MAENEEIQTIIVPPDTSNTTATTTTTTSSTTTLASTTTPKPKDATANDNSSNNTNTNIATTTKQDTNNPPTTTTKTMKSQIRAVLQTPQMKKLLFYMFVQFWSAIASSVNLPGYVAAWFGDCHLEDSKNNNNNDDCDFNFVKFAFYNTLFSSLRGLCRFIFAGLIGRLSDAYGRKYFLLFNAFLSMLPNLFVYIFEDFWVFYGFYVLVGISGASIYYNPCLSACIGDIIDSEGGQKTIAYGLISAVAGVGVLVGAITGVVISSVWYDYTPFLIAFVLYLINFIYVSLFLKETLQENNKVAMTYKHYNPFQPLCEICNLRNNSNNDTISSTHNSTHTQGSNSGKGGTFNNIGVFWTAIVTLTAGIAAVGFSDTVIPYSLDRLDVDSSSQSGQITGSMAVLMGITGIISNAVFVPNLKKRGKSDYQVLLISCTSLFISFVMFILVAAVPNLVVVAIGAFFGAASTMYVAAVDSICSNLSDETKQGYVFGIIFAVRGINAAIAPFTFGYGYTLADSIGVPFLPYIVGTIMMGIAVGMIFGPLKRSVSETERETIESKSDIDRLKSKSVDS